MTEPMHDLLAAAIDRRTNTFAEGRDFADAHESRVVRAIRGRRVAATVGTGVVAAALMGAAGYGIASFSGAKSVVQPGATATPTPSVPALNLEMVPVAIDAPGMNLFYVTFGATDTIPLSAFGIPYPGPGVPSDAVLVTVCGDVTGAYDPDPSNPNDCGPAVFDGRDGVLQRSPDSAFDVFGEVTSYTRWGIHFFLVDGTLVTEAAGRGRPDAVEVTAWVGSDVAAVAPSARIATDIVPLETDYPDWYYFYVTFGATDMIPFAIGGVDPPNAPDVPSDAILLFIHGGSDGYDLTSPGAMRGNFGVFDADASMGDTAVSTFDVIGNVTSTTPWGVHFYLVDDHLVTVPEGRANPNAVEVTAMFGSDGGSLASADLATPLETTLVTVPSNETIWPDGDPYRDYAFYATAGATDTIPFPFPESGNWYPGIAEVPSDAVLVGVDGDVGGFDLAAPHTNIRQIWAMPMREDNTNDMLGGLDNADSQWHKAGQEATMSWDVIGDVTDHTRWAVHYFVVRGKVVTEVEGRANPDAIEVTAWFDPASFTPTP